jgi:hypothetical protein
MRIFTALNLQLSEENLRKRVGYHENIAQGLSLVGDKLFAAIGCHWGAITFHPKIWSVFAVYAKCYLCRLSLL